MDMFDWILLLIVLVMIFILSSIQRTSIETKIDIVIAKQLEIEKLIDKAHPYLKRPMQGLIIKNHQTLILESQ